MPPKRGVCIRLWSKCMPRDNVMLKIGPFPPTGDRHSPQFLVIQSYTVEIFSHIHSACYKLQNDCRIEPNQIKKERILYAARTIGMSYICLKT